MSVCVLIFPWKAKESVIGEEGYFLVSECDISYYKNCYSNASQKGW